MLPAAIASLFRFTSIAVSAALVAAPWLLSTLSEDPYQLQTWVILAVAAIAISEMVVVFPFFRPRRGHFGFSKILLLIFAILSLSMYFSDFSISLRTTVVWLSLLLIIAFLRLSRQQIDNRSIAGMLCLSGLVMAIYALFQHAGYDFFHWSSSPYSMVGTFSNPNFLAAYLMMTSVFTLGMALEPVESRFRDRLILGLMFVTQAVAIFISGAISAILGLVLGTFLLVTNFWEVKPGRILRLSPFIAGAIICIVLVLLQALVFYATASYPWENLSTAPYHYFSLVSRLVVWQMGFSIFLSHPVIGLGPGAIKFLMPQQRPPFGTSLGIKVFNDDPHSILVSTLAETGMAGLFAFSALFCYLVGVAIWRRSKTQDCSGNCSEGNPSDSTCWLSALIPAIISILGFTAGFIGLRTFFYSLPVIVVFHGFYNCFLRINSGYETQKLSKTPLVVLLIFVFHSSFNNNLSVFPLMLTAALVASLLLSSSLRDVAWKKRFSLTTLPYLCVPVLFVFVAYNLQASYQHEQKMLYQGSSALQKGEAGKAQLSFEAAIKANPQSLKAHFGLAMSLKKQGLLDDARNILLRLDSIVPNAFNANFELARILLERKHLLEAHRYALKSLEWNMTPQNYELLGKILLLEGKISEAEKIFTEALVFVPVHIREERLAADRIRLNLAALAANRNDFSQCEDYLKQITSSVKDSSDALYLRGMILSKSGEIATALEFFEKALIQSPENPKIMNAVGFLLVKSKLDLDRAQKLLESAHQLVKSSETPMLSDLLMVAHSLGILYWKQGKLKEAEKLLEIAWEQSPVQWQQLKETRFNDLKEFYRETENLEALSRLEEPAPKAGGEADGEVNDADKH